MQHGIVFERRRDMEFGCGVVLRWIGRHPVFKRNRMFRHNRLYLDRTCILQIKRPCRDVNVMSAPVGHFAAGVLIPPTEFIMAAGVTVLAVGVSESILRHRSLAEPHVPVESLRHIDHINRLFASWCAADGDSDGAEFTDATFTNQCDSSQKIQIHFTALLRSDLENTTCLVKHFANHLAFVDGQSEWLFAVHVLAGSHGFDRDFSVPVIRRYDRDDFDVRSIQDPAIVFVHIDCAFSTGLALHLKSLCFSFLDMCFIDITHGSTISKMHRIRANGVPAISSSDTTKDRSLVRTAERRCKRRWRKPVRCGSRS